MQLFRLLLVAATSLYYASSQDVMFDDEGEGYEDVSDIAAHLEAYPPTWDAAYDVEGEEWDEDEAWDQHFNETLYDLYAEDYDMYDEETGEFVGDEDYSNSTGSLRGRMSSRDRQWLASHNSRRAKYHQKFRKGYKALKWSPGLKAASLRWAKHLASYCGSRKIFHDPRNPYGENLASNMGTGSWGAQPSTDKVLARLVEREAGWGYPKNAHFTQVIWRSTRYVGCADAVKQCGKKKNHVQVCRYARPGNCNMGKYKNNFRTPMLADSSKCTPACPPGGCK